MDILSVLQRKENRVHIPATTKSVSELGLALMPILNDKQPTFLSNARRLLLAKQKAFPEQKVALWWYKLLVEKLESSGKLGERVRQFS